MTTLRTRVLRLPRLTFSWPASVAPSSTTAPEAFRTTRNNYPLTRQSTRCFAASCPFSDISADVPAARAYREILESGKRRLPPGAPKERKAAEGPALPPGMVRKQGTVISAGRMDRTVRVKVVHQVWDKFFRRYFPKKTNYMVHDPRNSLREGDVVEFVDGWRVSRRVRHVVERIVAPFGTSPEERPPVMNWQEREEDLARKRETGEAGTIKMGKIKQKVLRRLEEEAKRQVALQKETQAETEEKLLAAQEAREKQQEIEAEKKRKDLERQRIREEQEIIQRAMNRRRQGKNA